MWPSSASDLMRSEEIRSDHLPRATVRGRLRSKYGWRGTLRELDSRTPPSPHPLPRDGERVS